MKYMILVYASQQDYDAMGGNPAPGKPVYSPADFAAMGEFMANFSGELAKSGELVETRGLTAPVHARRLRTRDGGPGSPGVPVVTDGPYAETEEVLAGYWIVECGSFDRATEIAGRLAQTPGPAGSPGVANTAYADVRPIAESRDELDI